MTLLHCCLVGLLALGQAQKEGTRVAVVNIPHVSEKYQKTTDLEAHFDGIRRKLSQDRDGMRERLERLKRSLQEELKPGTEEFLQRRREVAMLEAEIQWFIEVEGSKVDAGLGASLREIYGDIQRASREVAEARGIDVVLASDALPDATPDNSAQVRQQILLQKVIYWSPNVDISEEVIKRLNDRYAAEKAKNPPLPTAPGK